MNFAFVLLTAAACAASDPAPTTPMSAPYLAYPIADAEPEQAEKPSFFARLRGLFHRQEAAPSERMAVQQPIAVTAQPGCNCGAGAPRSMVAVPMPSSAEPPAPLPAIARTIETVQPSMSVSYKKTSDELSRPQEKRLSSSPDYGKLTGQLSYVHSDGGLWVLRYAPLGTEDANGGSVVLARDTRMDGYREGDLVAVDGQLLNQKASLRLGAPLYRIQSISLVDRPLP